MFRYPSDFQYLTEVLESRFIVAQLKNILRALGLRLSGNKGELVARIRSVLIEAVQSGSLDRYKVLKDAILDQLNSDRNGDHSYTDSSSVNTPSSKNAQGQGNRARTVASLLASPVQRSPVQIAPSSRVYRPLFQNSPFYDCLEAFTPICSVPQSSARNVVQFQFDLSKPASAKNKEQPEKYKIFLFCGNLDLLVGQGAIDFPLQVEVRVNGAILKQNLRGIKNKAGTARPADITSLCNLWAGPPGNQITMTYANTDKSYTLQACLVQVRKLSELIEKLRDGARESKADAKKKLTNIFEDEDIITTSIDISLKDPFSFSRIELPCRSIFCQHIQCFDATSFLQVNELMPTWTCPICGKSCFVEDLVVSEYMQELLKSAEPDAESITIDPQGNWNVLEKNTENISDGDENDRDTTVSARSSAEVKTEDTTFNVVKDQSQVISNEHVPSAFDKREHTCSPARSRRRSKSKGPGTVIDLTLSSDDDDDNNTNCSNINIDTSKSLQYLKPQSANERSLERLRVPGRSRNYTRSPVIVSDGEVDPIEDRNSVVYQPRNASSQQFFGTNGGLHRERQPLNLDQRHRFIRSNPIHFTIPSTDSRAVRGSHELRTLADVAERPLQSRQRLHHSLDQPYGTSTDVAHHNSEGAAHGASLDSVPVTNSNLQSQSLSKSNSQLLRDPAQKFQLQPNTQIQLSAQLQDHLQPQPQPESQCQTSEQQSTDNDIMQLLLGVQESEEMIDWDAEITAALDKGILDLDSLDTAESNS